MTVIHPRSLEEAVSYVGEYRAGGTDVEARRRIGLTQDVTIDLRNIPGIRGVERSAEGTRIGAMTRVTTIATELGYPPLAMTAASLANPHTRAAGTLGGNLLQQTRCWYYRTGDVDCFKTGVDGCPARSGIHHFGNIFDTSSCVAPHPSSLGMALMLYDAQVEVHPHRAFPIADLYDAVDPTAEHTLGSGEIVTSVLLPPPVEGERGAYWRATARSLAEWPLVEAACRLLVEGDRITDARVAVGGVGPVPRRLPAVEESLQGAVLDGQSLSAAATRAATGARPAPQASYKVALLEAAVGEVLERAIAGADSSELAMHERPL
ncbi:MAG: FAD binding domain-containing protein [Acidimicrobiia bacterium]